MLIANFRYVCSLCSAAQAHRHRTCKTAVATLLVRALHTYTSLTSGQTIARMQNLHENTTVRDELPLKRSG